MIESIMSAVTVLNLLFCAVILLLGLYVYFSRRNQFVLLVAASFGLFGASHVITLMGMAAALEFPLVIIRATAYALVIVALFADIWGSMKEAPAPRPAAKPAPKRRRR